MTSRLRICRASSPRPGYRRDPAHYPTGPPAEFDGRGGRQDLVQFGWVLHARKLHDDPVHALALDEQSATPSSSTRLRSVVIDGEILPLANLVFGHAHGKRLAVGTVGDQYLGVCAADQRRGTVIGIASRTVIMLLSRSTRFRMLLPQAVVEVLLMH